MKGIVIYRDAAPKMMEFKGSCGSIGNAIGGGIQIFPHPKGMGAPVTSFVDEEGKLKNLSFNKFAMIVMQKFGYKFDYDYPVGHVVMIGKNERSISADALQTILSTWEEYNKL